MSHCKNMTIATKRESRILWCPDCEAAHVQLRGVTLHLERDSLQALHTLLQEAVETLAQLDGLGMQPQHAGRSPAH